MKRSVNLATAGVVILIFVLVISITSTFGYAKVSKVKGSNVKISSIRNIEVKLIHYQKYKLPKTVKAVMSNKTKKNVIVI